MYDPLIEDWMYVCLRYVRHQKSRSHSLVLEPKGAFYNQPWVKFSANMESSYNASTRTALHTIFDNVLLCPGDVPFVLLVLNGLFPHLEFIGSLICDACLTCSDRGGFSSTNKSNLCVIRLLEYISHASIVLFSCRYHRRWDRLSTHYMLSFYSHVSSQFLGFSSQIFFDPFFPTLILS